MWSAKFFVAHAQCKDLAQTVQWQASPVTITSVDADIALDQK
jgi:hypothetical protein